MEVEIRTGFQNISHNIIFQPNTEFKGKNVVKAGHVREVKELRSNGISYKITADVIRQTSINEVEYKVQLKIDQCRVVTETSCTCAYNKSEKCKHVAALIYYINFNESLSKTDHEQLWGKPTTRQFAKEKYRKGRYFFEMFPPPTVDATATADVPYQFVISDFKRPSALKIIKAAEAKDECEYAVKSVMNFMLDTVEVNLKQEECKSCVQHFLITCKNFKTYSNNISLDKNFKSFYDNFIKLSTLEVLKLSCDTLEQSNCNKWFEQRRIRISSSKGVHSIKSRVSKTKEKLVNELLREKPLDLKSLNYGIEHEKHARSLYENKFNCKVQQVGLIVSVKQPWLCTSLDGVVIINNSITRLVEFKCPSTCEKMSIVDIETQQSNVPYLKFVNGRVVINESHSYYTQCQTQMYLTGMSECDLFVYSPVTNGSCNIRICRDESFLKNVILKCEDFYFKDYLPVVCKFMNENCYVNKHLDKESPSRLFTGRDISNKIN